MKYYYAQISNYETIVKFACRDCRDTFIHHVEKAHFVFASQITRRAREEAKSYTGCPSWERAQEDTEK